MSAPHAEEPCPCRGVKQGDLFCVQFGQSDTIHLCVLTEAEAMAARVPVFRCLDDAVEDFVEWNPPAKRYLAGGAR